VSVNGTHWGDESLMMWVPKHRSSVSPTRATGFETLSLWLPLECAGWSSAHVADVCRESGMQALRRDIHSGGVTWEDVTRAFKASSTTS
jgi:ATP-dependent 26S proteasome regulatory subunit